MGKRILSSKCSVNGASSEVSMTRSIKPVSVVSRGDSYQLYYYNTDGQRRRLSVGSDYLHAQRMAVKYTDWLIEGKDPEREMKRAEQQENAKQITLKEFFPEFMERHGTNCSKSMQVRFDVFFSNLKRCLAIANSPICDLSKRIILDYMKLRMKADGVSSATANREGSFVCNVLNRAVEWDILERNPLHGLRFFKEAGKRNVALSIDQVKSLIDNLPEPIADIVEFAIYTGFRKENILSLSIEQLRLHDLTPSGEVDLVVKGDRFETFALGKLSVELLRKVIDNRIDGYVFQNPKTKTRWVSIHKPFDGAIKKLDLKTKEGKKLRFHDLRHMFGYFLSEAGVSLDNIRELMGHKDRATTDRYVTVNRKAVGAKLDLIPPLRNTKAPADDQGLV